MGFKSNVTLRFRMRWGWGFFLGNVFAVGFFDGDGGDDDVDGSFLLGREVGGDLVDLVRGRQGFAEDFAEGLRDFGCDDDDDWVGEILVGGLDEVVETEETAQIDEFDDVRDRTEEDIVWSW